MLEVKSLECFRGERTLFKNLSFKVESGEILQVEGHNGAGKTSLLRILATLALPISGEVLWNGNDIDEIRADYLADLAYLGHHPGVKGELTPLENLRIAQSLHGLNHKHSDLFATLKQFSLNGFEDVPCHTLSAGQNRRVALARLLATTNKIWILDEPFTAIDKTGVKKIQELFENYLKAGGIIIITTHQPLEISTTEVRTLSLGKK